MKPNDLRDRDLFCDITVSRRIQADDEIVGEYGDVGGLNAHCRTLKYDNRFVFLENTSNIRLHPII